jgi:hypothetical protein
VVSVFAAVGSGIRDVFEGIGSWIRGVFEGIINWIVDKLNWCIDKLDDILDNIPFVDAHVDKLDHIGKQGREDDERRDQFYRNLKTVGDMNHGSPSIALPGPTAMLGPSQAYPGAARGGAGAGSSVNTGDIKTTIQINGAGDPKAVALETQKVFDANMARVLRHAQGTLGTGGSDVG